MTTSKYPYKVYTTFKGEPILAAVFDFRPTAEKWIAKKREPDKFKLVVEN